MSDARKNFAISLVATAPSPAMSGTTLTVSTGHGTRFPVTPFNAVVCPAGTAPTPENAEVIRMTLASGDTFNIVRSQEGSNPRPITVGDQIAQTTTALMVQDAEQSAGLNVKRFGARGDGVTDDTAAIQAALNYFDNNPILGGELNSNGAIFFPRGRYKITSQLTLHNAYGVTVRGEGSFCTAIEFSTTTATALRVDSYFRFRMLDISIHNTSGGGNNAGSQTGTNGLLLDSNGTGSLAMVERCAFTNWVNCVKNGGTLSGDSGLYTQCHFRRSTNAWYSDNPMSGIQKFDQCVYDLITLGGVNTQGVGMIHIDTPNFVGAGSLLYLRPVASEWGFASNFVVTNGKMEWTSPSSMWVNMPGTGGTEIYGEGTFTFNGCSMSGGDGGEVGPTDVIMQLCGAVNVAWNGGNFAGTVKYIASTTLSQANPNTFRTRAQVVFNGAKHAPKPADIIILDPSAGASGAGEPVFKWRDCANLPDLEMGGNVGYNSRELHTIKFNPLLKSAVIWSYEQQPQLCEIDFHGRPVRIHEIILRITGIADSPTAGNRVASAWSDASRTVQVGTVTFTTDVGAHKLTLDTDPSIITGGKLYLKLAVPEPEGTFYGAWLVTYTCL